MKIKVSDWLSLNNRQKEMILKLAHKRVKAGFVKRGC